MKRLVRYKLNFGSKLLTLSGVMMGFAFFLQALDYFALRQLQSVDRWTLVLFLILPMVMEALWCVPMRSEKWRRAEAHGVFAALTCLVLLGQAVFSGGIFSIVLNAVFLVLSGTVAVLITWGFIPHRALGMLVFTAAVAQRLIIVTLSRYAAAPTYMTLVQEIPPVCILLGMMFFFGGIRMCDTDESEIE